MLASVRSSTFRLARNFSTAVPKVSIVSHPYDLVKADFEEEYNGPPKNVFAVCSVLGRQYKVTEDDIIVADRLNNVDIGDVIDLDDIMMVGSKYGTLVGRPIVPGARVTAYVEELTKDKKVTILKFRRRKNSKRTKGFRRDITVLRIKEIITPEEYKEDLKL